MRGFALKTYEINHKYINDSADLSVYKSISTTEKVRILKIFPQCLRGLADVGRHPVFLRR